MTKLPNASLAMALLLFLGTGHSPARGDRPILERETTHHSFELPAGVAPRLIVDNFFGRIEIRKHQAPPAPGRSPRIDLELTRTVRGSSPEKLEQARREVHLDMTAEAGTVDLYVDAPHRQQRAGNRHWQWRDPGYRVVYDFVLSVPARIDLEVKTVSDGDVRIFGTRGEFAVANVNGEVEMRQIGGSGSATTVNGGVEVTFRDNPAGDSDFATVNGDVEVRFRSDLEADLRLESSFGELWSEFEVKPLPALPVTESFENGRRIIRTDGSARVRVGTGGASHSFETLTGDVRIRRADSGSGSGESSP